MLKHKRVTNTADALRDTSQVPMTPIVHAQMIGALTTMCGLDATTMRDMGRQASVLSCPTCRRAMTQELHAQTDAEFRTSQRTHLKLADAELIMLMQMRANTLRNAREGHNESLAADLEIVAGRLAEHAQIPDNTSVPQAPDDALSADKVLDTVLLALHEKLPYPTEACAIVRSLKSNPAHLARENNGTDSVYTGTERRARPRFIEVNLEELHRDLAANREADAAAPRVTLGQVILRINNVSDKFGAPAARAILDTLGVRKMNEIPVEKLQHALTLADAALTPQPLTKCAAARDGDCCHIECPQLRDDEPRASGRHCPLDKRDEES